MEKMIINLSDIDITTSADFAEYSADKEQLNTELNTRPFIRTYLPPEIKARDEALSASLKKLSPTAFKAKGDELIRAQGLDQKHNELITHMMSKSNGNAAHFDSLWSPMLWQAREDNSQTNVIVGNQKMKVFDLDFVIAEGLQQLYAEADPRAEYHDWIERQHKIEVDLNTGGASEEEIAARNTFISFLDDRETELKRVIFLYAGSAFNPNSRQQAAAQEKLKFLTFKLSELRRLRERTGATKSRADDKEYLEKLERRREREAAVATGLIAAEMISLGNQKLKQNNLDTATMEHGIGESFIQLHPETATLEQSRAKIDTARQNSRELAAMFAAMRRGMSKEEWLRQNQNPERSTSDNIRSSIQRRRGWTTESFNEYARA